MNRPCTVTPASPLSHLAGAADAGCARLRLTATLLTGTAASRTQISGHVMSPRNGTRAASSAQVHTAAARIT